MPMGCALENMRCLVAVTLACAVAVSPARAQTPAAPVSSIRVTGDAKVTVRPDRVLIDIGVSTPAAQSQEAAPQCARQGDAGLAAVRKATRPTVDPHALSRCCSDRGTARATRATRGATPVEAGTLVMTADVMLTVEVSPTAR